MCAVLLFGSAALAEAPTQNAVNVTDTVQLTPEQEQEARAIAGQIKCPVCKGESLLTSSNDLSRQIYLDIKSQVKNGVGEAQILNYMVSRYGETILLNPPKKGLNWLLWIAPVAVLLGAGWALSGYLKNASRPPVVSSEDLERVNHYLQKEKES
ncbi:hypothetical protein DC3_44820 [Deinococcus cellulosilyticus NBRC 106333 = KACC 11606]|uniref:Cytochrome c-type biogenesis protein n=1 Tax=Deinococcus cellulosilyticus (strain DSM 18568 / NBRC 106333 / KACC 11606 / 5516J-15) TaxID=1223518 RepID=A0A511N8I6_DEIC1|nr:hypothetical protein DC3_44820 [Deinococcus cellulosilyticus NBRC 106333 = KACC 11606]